jgi:hypothetical protein
MTKVTFFPEIAKRFTLYFEKRVPKFGGFVEMMYFCGAKLN